MNGLRNRIVKKEGAGAMNAPAVHMKKIVCIESEATHLLLGGTLLTLISKAPDMLCQE
jgi:hypothetical protein